MLQTVLNPMEQERNRTARASNNIDNQKHSSHNSFRLTSGSSNSFSFELFNSILYAYNKHSIIESNVYKTSVFFFFFERLSVKKKEKTSSILLKKL